MILLTLLLQISMSPPTGMEIFDPLIRTIQLYPDRDLNGLASVSPAVPLEQQNLILEFDDLRESNERYYAKIIHCNSDWQPSGLRDLEFLPVYNEFNIDDFAYSTNTHLPYVHYRFDMPEVRLPGNYILFVFRNGDEEDKAFNRRFMVFDNKIIAAPMIRPGQMALDKDLQHINFTVTIGKMDIPDPFGMINVIVRQNNRWDNQLANLKPIRTDGYRGQLDYTFFDRRSGFRAGNEFRFFDITSLNFPGVNTAQLDRSKKPFQLYLATDRPRGQQVYEQYRDLNGSFILNDRDGGFVATTGQYVYVHFLLDYQPASDEELYISGSWSDYGFREAYRLRNNGTMMEAIVLLKQGFYNYRYTSFKNGKENSVIEGDYSETENDYEILVYFKDMRLQVDLLAGYSAFKVNPR